MKKLPLTTLLLFCVNAHTANFENVFGNTFISIESIKKHNGRVVFDVVINYSVPQEAKAGWIQSEVTYGYEADCENDQLFNSFNTQHFSRKNGKGAKREWKSGMERGHIEHKTSEDLLNYESPENLFEDDDTDEKTVAAPCCYPKPDSDDYKLMIFACDRAK